ncbi:MAG TPA: alpha/beta hydrolase [Pirellulales bacterium]|jgi:acetyl esterase/lipase
MLRTPKVKLMQLTSSLVVLLAIGATDVARADEPEIDFQSGVVYGKGGEEELKLDIASPKGLDHPVPAIIFIHGGGWAAGSRDHMAGFVKQAAGRGFVAATVSYRLAPKHVFPAQVEDVKCAVRWLRANAKDRHINPDQIGAIGMSAGAHLAMMLGAMDPSDGLEGEGGNSDQPSKVQAVVSYVGPTNLVGEYPPVSSRILETFLGGKPQDKPEECKRASPLTYVNRGDAPMLLFFGTKDPLIPVDQAYQMSKALTDAAVPARVELIVGAGHGWGGKEMDRTLEETWDFFGKNLKK